ncbi:Extracellular serine protease precursor [compost metagenome]
MNHVYRSIWNAALGCWVAVSELTRTCGKRKLRGIASVTTGPHGRLRLLNTALVLAGLLCAPGIASAQTAWNAAAGGDWNSSVNWTDGVPTGASIAQLLNAGDQANLSTAGTAQKLYVHEFGQIIVTTGGALVVGDLISLGDFPKIGGGDARLTIEDGGTVSTLRLFAGDGPTRGIVTVTGAGSSLTVASTDEALNQRFLIGALGAGELHIDAGANVTVNGTRTLHLGMVDKGNGTLFIGSGVGAGTLTAERVILNTEASSVQFDHTGSTTFSAAVSGNGALAKTGAGITLLTGANTYTGGTTVSSGTLALGSGGSLSAVTALTVGSGATFGISASGSHQTVGSLAGAGTLALGSYTLSAGGNNQSTTFSGSIGGTGGLIKTGTGTLTLRGANSYNGGTTIQAGTLALGAGGSLSATSALNLSGAGSTFDMSSGGNQTLGALNGVVGSNIVLGANTLTFGSAASTTFAGNISGTGGSLIKNGGGTMTLNGVNTYTGVTNVLSGSLVVGAASVYSTARLNSNVNVASGASIGGFGQVNGAVAVQSGGKLTPGDIGGTFTVNGNLTMGQGSQLNYSLGAPGASGAPGAGHSVQVNGDLALNGAQLDIADAGGFGVGLYRLFDYTGALTLSNGGINGIPSGQTIQYLSGSKQVNLISTQGLALNLWNANGLATSSQLGGGSGVWSKTSANWTDATGSLTAAMNPQPGFAIFGGVAGTVTIDNAAGAVQATGMQFASDGYRLTGGALDLVAAPSSVDPAEIRVGDGSAGSSSWTVTIDNVLTGSASLKKTGLGALVFNGANTYTGGTLLEAGTLVANSNDALGAGAVTVRGAGQNSTLQVNAGIKLTNGITLGSGGTLTGLGSVGNTTVQSGGIIAPGLSGGIGMLTVEGDLEMQSGALYHVQAALDGSASSLIDVTGKATLAGSVLHVGPQPNAQTDFQVGQTYTILTAGSIIGTFGAATSSYAYLDAKLDYSIANQVDLELKRKSNGGNNGGQMHFADLANTSNQGAAANAIESLPSSHPLYQHIETLPAGTPAAVFNSLSGDAHSTVMGSVNMLSAQAPNISQQHLRSNLTAGFRSGAPIAQSDGPLPASAFPSSKALPAWVEVVGHWQKMDGNSNAPGVKQNTTGLFLGADEEVGSSGWRVGGSVGYTSADAKVSSRDASADISSYSAAVYTGKGFSHGANRINVIGGLAYTKHSIESERSVAALNQNLKADYSAHTAQLFAEVGYAMGQYDKQGFEPFVGITLGEQRTNSFKESGGFAALSSESSRDTLASTTLGVRAHSDFVVAGKDTRVRASLGMRHAWGNLSQNRTMAFEGSSSFTVAGAPLARNTALVGLQAEMALSRYSALVLGYNGEYGSGSRDQSASVKVRWAF